MKDLDIVTLTYNSTHCIKRFTDGLKNGKYDDFHLTVIDGCSNPQEQESTLIELHKSGLPFTWLPLPENYFHTRAINNIPAYHESVNPGLKFVQGPYILLMNPDCFGDKEEGWLELAISTFKKHENVIGMMGAMLFHHDDTIDHAGGGLTADGLPTHMGRGAIDEGQFDGILWETVWNTGAWQLSTKKVLEEVGYHRCDGQWGSDYLIGLDVAKAGYKNVCGPFKLYHNEHESSDADFYKTNFEQKKRSY